MQVKLPIQEKEKFSLFKLIYVCRFWVMGAIGLVCLSAILLTQKGGSARTLAKSFIQVDSFVDAIEKGEGVDLAPIQGLTTAHPELKPLFDHHISQSLVLNGETAKGVKVGEDLLQRLTFIDTPYADYARASLLIESKNLEGALEASYQLQKFLSGKEGEFSRLHLFNLVRIASLERTLGKASASSSWLEVKKALSDESPSVTKEIRAEVLSHFSDEHTAIFDTKN